MTIKVSQGKAVAAVTVATDRKTMLPPLCQILQTLCCSPMSFRGPMQSITISVLATIQIMVGLFNIGLGPGRTSLHPGDFACLGVAYWLGGLFIATGIACLVADRFPSTYMVGFAVVTNVVGSISATAGIVLYAVDVSDVSAIRFCDGGDDCRYVASYFKRLVTAMDISMIVLTVLQLFICVNVAVLGISALFPRKEEGGRDDEIYQPEMKEVLMTGPGV